MMLKILFNAIFFFDVFFFNRFLLLISMSKSMEWVVVIKGEHTWMLNKFSSFIYCLIWENRNLHQGVNKLSSKIIQIKVSAPPINFLYCSSKNQWVKVAQCIKENHMKPFLCWHYLGYFKWNFNLICMLRIALPKVKSRLTACNYVRNWNMDISTSTILRMYSP